MSNLRLAIGSDHGGFDLKEAIKQHISKRGAAISIIDLGTHNTDSVDYPDFGEAVAKAIQTKEADVGILVCGTGIGISIAANRHKGVRAALAHNEFTAQMSKAHNNANILCLGARVTPEVEALTLVDLWLDTPFEGDRHQRRVEKLG